MIINEQSHPNIIKAFFAIEEDSGNRLRIPVRDIPAKWDKYIPTIEAAIGTLSESQRPPEETYPLPDHVKPDAYLDSEFYAFCNGEYDVMTAISNRNREMLIANKFLTDFFEDWMNTEDTGMNSPDQRILEGRIEYLEYVQRESSTGLTPDQTAELEQLKSGIL